MHKEGRDISMATKKRRGRTGGGEVECYRWTGHLSQTGRDKTLVKNDLNTTRSQRQGTQHEVGLSRAFPMLSLWGKDGGERKRRKAAPGSHKNGRDFPLRGKRLSIYDDKKGFFFFFFYPAKDFLNVSLSSPSEQL